MNKLIKVFGLVLVCAVAAVALGLPTGGAKVDTKKVDEVIAAIDDVSNKFAAAKAKVDACQTTLTGIAEAHGVSNILSDLGKVATLKDQITAEEKAKLQADAAALATIPDDIAAVTAAIPDILTNKLPAALTDIANQITKNPLAAADLKNKQDKLNQGKAALEQIGNDAPALVESAKSLGDAVAGIL